MIPTWIKTDTFDTVVAEAMAACATPQFNLLLAYDLPLSVLTSPFVEAHRRKAEKWIADPPSPDLFFSHGQFFRGQRGIAYVLEELGRKSLSRRAILATLSMDTLLASAGQSTPAFALFQVCIDGDILYATAYFRALEVGHFLPINLTEVALHASAIVRKFPVIHTIRLAILAFRAYHEPDFACLEKAPIDSQPIGTIAVAVAEHRYDKIREWLAGKLRVESVVQLSGVEELRNAVELAGKPYGAPFRTALATMVTSLIRFKTILEQSNEGAQVDVARKVFVEHLKAAIEMVPQ